MSPHRRVTQAQLRLHGRLTFDQPGMELADASIGPGGEAIVLWASRLGAKLSPAPRGVDPFAPSFAFSFVSSPTQVHVTVHSPSAAVRHTPIDDLRLVHPHIQPLPNGEVLVSAPPGGQRRAPSNPTPRSTAITERS